MEKDYYQVLGVLPTAEQIVVASAYRALANFYHPDKWTGDPVIANARMCEINAAYEVLGDETRRQQYNRSRQIREEFAQYAEVESEPVPEEATKDIEEQWHIAEQVYPDLAALRKRLGRVSALLSYEYMSSLLESKQFENRHSIALKLESAFLKRHFGSSPEVCEFARMLLGLKDFAAVAKLSKLVSVMGDSVASEKLINQITREFGFSYRAVRLKSALLDCPYPARHDSDSWLARELVKELGLKVRIRGFGILKPMRVELQKNGELLHFSTEVEFINWVIREFVSSSVDNIHI